MVILFSQRPNLQIKMINTPLAKWKGNEQKLLMLSLSFVSSGMEWLLRYDDYYIENDKHLTWTTRTIRRMENGKEMRKQIKLWSYSGDALRLTLNRQSRIIPHHFLNRLNTTPGQQNDSLVRHGRLIVHFNSAGGGRSTSEFNKPVLKWGWEGGG